MEIDRSTALLPTHISRRASDTVDRPLGEGKVTAKRLEVNKTSALSGRNGSLKESLDNSPDKSRHDRLRRHSEPIAPQYSDEINARVTQALGAYVSEQNQLLLEEQDRISSLLGVDYYV